MNALDKLIGWYTAQSKLRNPCALPAAILIVVAIAVAVVVSSDMDGRREYEQAKRDDMLMRETPEDRYFRRMAESIRKAND